MTAMHGLKMAARALLAGVVLLVVAATPLLAESGGPAAPMWLVLPFVVLLLMIATGPVLYADHWHHHYPKYAVGLGVLVALYYFFVAHDGGPVLHAAQEYVSFITLIAALFIASGGILVQTDFAGTPRANVILLFIGAVIANLIGTTGASMLLIRPFLRLNVGRVRPYHVVFFIFIVSNVGGALTPIGDPPLFLGFLRGVPFLWTLKHFWPVWLFGVAFLLAVFYVIDHRNHRHSIREDLPEEKLAEEAPDTPVLTPTTLHGPVRLKVIGAKTFGWLAVIIACVFIDPNVLPGIVPNLHALGSPIGVREVLLLVVCYLAYRTADRRALKGNGFTFDPVKEVAWLFVGIFLTMQPALARIAEIAHANADALTIHHFYFGTGMLSGVLDNAPTYLSFLTAAAARFGVSVDDPASIRALALDFHHGFYVEAISIAAVFWGALTYIGNGPNFMVRSIAESSGFEAPSFFGYFLRYALPVLVPMYLLVWLIFFSGYVLPT